MTESLVSPKVDEVDIEAIFFQLLDEADQHNTKTKLVSAPENPNYAENLSSSKDKKGNKSWKATLFSWMGSKKESKPQVDHEIVARNTNHGKGHVSGRIHGSMSRLFTKPRWLTWGPLSRIFNPTRTRNETDYVSLKELQIPDRFKPY